MYCFASSNARFDIVQQCRKISGELYLYSIGIIPNLFGLLKEFVWHYFIMQIYVQEKGSFLLIMFNIRLISMLF
jgi:hypothetical protein